MVDPESKRSRSGIPLDGLARVLQFVRHELGMSQKDLADATKSLGGAGVSAATIAKLETGARGPSQDTLEAVCAGLGVEPDAVERTAIAWHERHGDGASELALIDLLQTVFDGGPSQQEYVSVPPRTQGARGGGTAPGAETLLVQSESPERYDPTALPAPRSDSEEHVLLAAVPPGTKWLLAPGGLGVDADGQIWIDPTAPVTDTGDPDEKAVVERWDDGTYHVDTTDLGAIGRRNPRRHTYRAHTVDRTLPSRQELEAVYDRTIITIQAHEGEIRLDRTEERQPELPEDWRTVHVITAWNPRSRLLLDAQNRERNRMLRRDLAELGLDLRPAIAGSADGSWAETGFAVANAPEDVILDLARRYEQNAVYRWDRDGIHVVWATSR